MPHRDLLSLYKLARTRPDYDYFQHTVEQAFIKLGLKYLSLKLYEEALGFAFEMNSGPLMVHAKVLARKQKHVFVECLVEHHRDKDGGASTNLMRSLVQIANFSKKQLKKEDFSNLYKDFDTLLKIDDVTDLELNDFNTWDLNLEAYQKALDLEFDGKFEAAMKIYEENGLNNDVFRVKSILGELNKELRDGEKHLIFQDLRSFIS